MGFLDQAATAREHPLTVLLPGFQVRCALTSFGPLHTFINDDQKKILTLSDATLHGLEVGNPAASMSLPELFVSKTQCHALAFETELPREETGLMPRAEPLVMYTSHYAIQGQFHMGADDLISDFVDVMKSIFVGATNASIFPLFQAQAAVIQQAPLLFIYRAAVWMHHAI